MLVIQRLKRQVSYSQGAYVCMEVTWEPNKIKPGQCAQYWRIVSVGCMATTALVIFTAMILCESPEITVMTQIQGSQALYLKRYITSLSLSFLIRRSGRIAPTFRDDVGISSF